MRGQIQHVFSFLLIGMVIAATVYLSIAFLGTITENACEAEERVLQRGLEEIERTFDTIGTKQEVELLAPCGADYLCIFSQTTKGDDVLAQTGLPGEQIRQQLKTAAEVQIGPKPNVFTFTNGALTKEYIIPKLEPAGTSTAEQPTICIRSQGGRFTFRTEGRGRTIEVNGLTPLLTPPITQPSPTTTSTTSTGTASETTTKTTTAESTSEYTSIDMNAVPDSYQVDETGWPTYLNVPDYCPPPESDKHYTYFWPTWQFGLTGRDAAPRNVPVAGRVEDATYKTFLDIPGSWTLSAASALDVFAVPFFAMPDPNWAFSISPSTGSGAAFYEITMSKCPGVSGDEYSVGEQCYSSFVPYQNSFTVLNREPESRNRFTPRCVVNEHEQYFLNIRLSNLEIGTSGNTYASRCQEMACHANSQINWGYNKAKYPPYTGPCLERGPYPFNYFSKFCRSNENLNRCTTGEEVTWTCRDGYDGPEIARFQAVCVNDDWTITEGANTPATSNMVCTATCENHVTSSNHYLCT